MTLPYPSPAGAHAGLAALCLKFGQQKTPIIADRGYYFGRATAAPQKPLVALRNIQISLWSHANECSL